MRLKIFQEAVHSVLIKNNILVTKNLENALFSGFCCYCTIERWQSKVKFKVNGLTWTVQCVQRDSEKLQVNDKDCLGVTYFQDLQIYIDGTLPKVLFRQTVIHELVHAFTFSFGVHLVANEETEEPVCDFIGAHLDEIYSITNKIMNSCYSKG